MERRHKPQARWDRTHNPEDRPLGCNGKYGSSGRQAHRKRGEPCCEPCRLSSNHYVRELKRGQGIPVVSIVKCGTPGGARRHYRLNEELCLPCKLAQTEAAIERYYRHKAMLG